MVSAASLAGRSVGVEVPATIANLGAGYDCLGLAVDLVLEVSVEAFDRSGGGPEVELTVHGEGAGELPGDRSNRLVQALDAGLDAAGTEGAAGLGWRIEMTNPIPLERGLGSSAAGTVAGLVAAGALAGRDLPIDTILRLATRIEGHPDNVATAFLGGLVASLADGGQIEAVRLDPPAGLIMVAWIPDRRLSTAAMRGVLPDSVPRADAVANLARVAVGVAGLATGRTDVISLLTEDRLHQPYRAVAYPELPALVAAACGAGALGACLAGAGSTVAAFVDGEERVGAVGAALEAVALDLNLPGRLAVLPLRSRGAEVSERRG
jgi:homoserine kinase